MPFVRWGNGKLDILGGVMPRTPSQGRLSWGGGGRGQPPPEFKGGGESIVLPPPEIMKVSYNNEIIV